MPEHTITEAAARLGLARGTVTWQIRRGKLAATLHDSPAGPYYLIDDAELERYRSEQLGRRGSPRRPEGDAP